MINVLLCGSYLLLYYIYLLKMYLNLTLLGIIKGKKDDKLGIRAASSCNIILENVTVSTENMLGKEGDGFKIAMSGIG